MRRATGEARRRLPSGGAAGAVNEDRQSRQVLEHTADLHTVGQFVQPEQLHDVAAIELLVAFDVDEIVRILVQVPDGVEEQRAARPVGVPQVV